MACGHRHGAQRREAIRKLLEFWQDGRLVNTIRAVAAKGYREGSNQLQSPERLRLDIHLLEPLSFLLLAVAFYFGLKRLSSGSLAANINHRLADAHEKREA